jgi:hypothetical protein
MGKSVGGVTLHPTAVQSVGLNLGLVDMHGEPNPHFREGGFELTLHEISTYERAISAHEMDTAAPAAAAPAAAAPAAAFGSCTSEVQDPLRWGSDREVANRICCHNSVYAEYGGYWRPTTPTRTLEPQPSPASFPSPFALLLAPAPTLARP